jgi:hypothetical protein
MHWIERISSLFDKLINASNVFEKYSNVSHCTSTKKASKQAIKFYGNTASKKALIQSLKI